LLTASAKSAVITMASRLSLLKASKRSGLFKADKQKEIAGIPVREETAISFLQRGRRTASDSVQGEKILLDFMKEKPAFWD